MTEIFAKFLFGKKNYVVQNGEREEHKSTLEELTQGVCSSD